MSTSTARTVAAFEARIQRLELRIAALEAGRGGPRDYADEDALVAIAEAAGAATFNASELLAHADANPRLHAALRNADIDGTWELGRLLPRLTRATGAIALECINPTDRRGRRYVVRLRP